MGMPVTVPRYTVDQLDDFPNDGNRYELLDGVLLVTPQASVPHQLIATRLVLILGSALQLTGHANVFAPGMIVLPPGTQLEPTCSSCHPRSRQLRRGRRSPSTGLRSRS